MLQKYKDLQDIIAILGMDELSEEDKLTVVARAQDREFLSQPFSVAEQFTGTPGEYVRLEDTIRGFKEILEGKHDDLPEQAFFMVGTIEDAIAQGEDAGLDAHRAHHRDAARARPSRATVDSVVLPGSEGDFGVLPGARALPHRAPHRRR